MKAHARMRTPHLLHDALPSLVASPGPPILLLMLLLAVWTAPASAALDPVGFFIPIYSNVATYVVTLVDRQCGPTYPACTPSRVADAFFDEAGYNIDQGSPCFQPRCFDTNILITVGLIDGYVGGIKRSYCAYGRELVEAHADVAASAAYLSEPPDDPRFEAQVLRWLPGIYKHMACEPTTAEVTPATQCARHMCGTRTASSGAPGSGPPGGAPVAVDFAEYGCHVLVDDQALALYGSGVVPGVPEGTVGSVRLVQRGSEPLQPYPPSAVRPRRLLLGYATAASYGVGWSGVPVPCGSATQPCTWDDPRTLFYPAPPAATRACTPDLAVSTSASCNAFVCNGAGRCGVPVADGTPCPTQELWLGQGFYDSAAYAFTPTAVADAYAKIDTTCLSAVPQCSRMATSRAAPPPVLQNALRAGAQWAAAALASAPATGGVEGSDLQMAAVFPSGDPPLDGPAVFALLQAAVVGSTLAAYAEVAPSLCALPASSPPRGPTYDCTSSSATLLPPPSHPECVVSDFLGNFRRRCVSNYASQPASPDGFLQVASHPALPGTVTFASCEYVYSGVDKWCTTPTQAAPPPATNLSCLTTRCDGDGGCGWYAREEGSPCDPDNPSPPGALWPCTRSRCSVDGRCLPQPEPVGTPCSTAAGGVPACVAGETCDGHGTCGGGTLVPVDGAGACVPCASDEDCVCTGSAGAAGSRCLVHLGVCAEGALAPPLAVPAGGPTAASPALATPLQPWELEALRAPWGQAGWGGGWEGGGVGAGGCAPGEPCAARNSDTATTLRACVVTPTNRGGGSLECLAGGVGVCHSDGTCGLPSPLRRFAHAWDTPPEVSAALLASQTPCVASTNGTTFVATDAASGASAECHLLPAYAGWFLAPGTPCDPTGTAADCAAGLCAPLDLWQVLPPAARGGSNATVCAPVTTCQPDAGFAAAQAVANASCTPAGEHPRREDLCVLSWRCADDASGRCEPEAVRQCDPAWTFYPGVDPPSAGPPTKADHGPCTRPSACVASTGRCTPAYEPPGTPCPEACRGVGTEAAVGACDGAGACRRGSSYCPTQSACQVSACSRTARVDNDTLWPRQWLGPAFVGSCVPRITELTLLSGGSVGCTDGNPCTTGDTCGGSGMCNPGGVAQCPTPANPCREALPCAAATGRCLTTPKVDGTPCGAGQPCLLAGGCAAGECANVRPVVCPPAPLPPAGSICGGTSVRCAAFGYFVPSYATDSVVLVSVGSGAGATLMPILSPTTPLPTTPPPFPLATLVLADGTMAYNDFPFSSYAGPEQFAGVCVYSATREGQACEVADPCVADAACVEGACVPAPGGLPVQCPSNYSLVCKSPLAACVSGVGCVHPPEPAGTRCDDGDRCTLGDACDASGQCVGSYSPTCPQPTQQCLELAPGAACATNCEPLQHKPNGTLCGCANPAAPTPETCKRTCVAGACRLPPGPNCTPPCGANACCVPPGRCECDVGFVPLAGGGGGAAAGCEALELEIPVLSRLWGGAWEFIRATWPRTLALFVLLLVPVVLFTALVMLCDDARTVRDKCVLVTAAAVVLVVAGAVFGLVWWLTG